MAGLVRLAAVAAFAAQIAMLWFLPTGERDPGALLFFAALSFALLIPLLTASRAKPRLNRALLLAFVPAVLAAVWLAVDVLTGTNSTAALGFLLLPVAQGFCFLIALVVGLVAHVRRAERELPGA